MWKILRLRLAVLLAVREYGRVGGDPGYRDIANGIGISRTRSIRLMNLMEKEFLISHRVVDWRGEAKRHIYSLTPLGEGSIVRIELLLEGRAHVPF